MTRREYEDKYGTGYRKPGFFVRFIVAVFKVVPKFGPFKPLAFEPLTVETERMFLKSFDASRARYRGLLLDQREGRLSLSEIDSIPAGAPSAASMGWPMRPTPSCSRN